MKISLEICKHGEYSQALIETSSLRIGLLTNEA